MQRMQYLYHKSDLHSPITIGVDLIFKIVFCFVSIFYSCSQFIHTVISEFLFFLNQQFITWGVVADHGSYFVTTYIKTVYKKKKERNKRNKKKKQKKNESN